MGHAKSWGQTMAFEEIWHGFSDSLGSASHWIGTAELSPAGLTALVLAIFLGCLVLPGHLSKRYANWFKAHPLRRLAHIGLSSAVALLAVTLLR